MNKIYKVIWSRCHNAFVVVSELSDSRARGRTKSTRRADAHGAACQRRFSRLATTSLPASSIATALFTKTFVGAALAFGSAAACAQAVEVKYGEPHISNQNVALTSWDNALTITGGGTGGMLYIENSTFSVKPVAVATGTPNAAIWVKAGDPGDRVVIARSNGTDFTTGVEIEVEGENLQGLHIESGAWVSLSAYSEGGPVLQISAKGENTTGIHVLGRFAGNAQIEVEGDKAKGIYIGAGGDANIDVSGLGSGLPAAQSIKVSGKDVVGIDVDGGNLATNALSSTEHTIDVIVQGEADGNATGLRINGNGQQSNINSLVIDLTNNQGAGHSTGVVLNDLSPAGGGKNITFGYKTRIKVAGGTDPGAVADGFTVAGGLGLTLREGASVDVYGATATGVRAGPNARVSMQAGATVDVEGTDMAKGFISGAGNTLDIAASTLNVSAQNYVEAVNAANNSTVKLSDGTTVTASSAGGTVYGIASTASTVEMDEATLSAESSASARGLYANGGDLLIQGSEIKSQGGDVRILEYRNAQLDMTQSLAAAQSTGDVIGIYGENSASKLSSVVIDVHSGGLGWRHAFGDRQPGARLSFIEGDGGGYTVVGAPIARNTAVFDLGAEAQVGRNTSVGLSYEGQGGSGFTQHAGNVYLRTRF